MKRWYVVQVFAGYEERVRADLKVHAQDLNLQDLIGQVLVPSAKLKSLFSFDEQQDQQLFPGYVLLEAELNSDVMRLVLSSPRVIKFLGGKEPAALSRKEIERILSQMKGEIALTPVQSDFVVGSEVEIKEGPFAGFVGIIDKVDEESEKLTVMVSIFGRMTPVELSFQHINR
ncbi:MAG TPA: transcription termination/antitermination protein NusG [Candidatus Babeliales bacterium]|jgi:transcriptional antiterminator NusG|nr:transcription termination/antitermination protein NusG [Candidatus Babeliales bacterium]